MAGVKKSKTAWGGGFVLISLLLLPVIAGYAYIWIRPSTEYSELKAQISNYFNSDAREYRPIPASPNVTTLADDPSCLALSVALPEIVYPPGHPAFNHPVESYWNSMAQELIPSCVVRPRTALDVSEAVKVLRSQYDKEGTSVRFAVRSGGHNVAVGYSSIDGGVLLDLRHLDSVTAAANDSTVSIGTGARWAAVYSHLDRYGHTTPGGRSTSVGVGGYLLGGGISYLSPQYGMACDNVVSYEVVLADGSIVTATEFQHEDLWRALKGGGSNFGIVTQITMRTFPATEGWGGYVYHWKSQWSDVLSAFASYIQPSNFDPSAAGPIMAFGSKRVLWFNVRLIVANIIYTKPVEWPLVWKPFKQVRSIWSTTKIQSMLSLMRELSAWAPYGLRQHQVTLTVKHDNATLAEFYEIFEESLPEIQHIQGMGRFLTMQPLTAGTVYKDYPSDPGANVLGLTDRPTDEPRVIVLIPSEWKHARDDDVVQRSSWELIRKMEAAALRRGTLDRYKYLNYAGDAQDVFGGYGEANHRFLREVAAKYDPTKFWQRAAPGGMKLDLQL